MLEMKLRARERVQQGIQWFQDEAPSDWLFRIAAAFGGPQALLGRGWLTSPESLLLAVYGDEPWLQIKDQDDNPVGPATVWSIASGIGLDAVKLVRSGFLTPRYFGPRAWESDVEPFLIAEWESRLRSALQQSMLPNAAAA